MKKILYSTVLTLTIFSGAGQAQAYFENDHLIQVFYTANNNKVEIGVDLGAVGTDFTLADQNKTLNAVNYATLAADKGATVNDLKMGMYVDSLVRRSDAVWDHYFVTTQNIRPSAPSSSWYSSIDTATLAISNYYQSSAVTPSGADVVTANPLNSSSYRTRMNGNGAVPGTYLTMNTFSASVTPGELNLNTMSGGYHDLYLWHFSYDTTTKTSQIVSGPTNDYSAILRFNANGSTVLNPASSSPVPLPGAAWLLGFGMTALASFRRRQSC